MSIPQLMKTGQFEITDKAVGIVCPVYAVEMPMMVRDFLKKAKIQTDYFFFIYTYGSGYGEAFCHAKLAAEEAGLTLNYINAVEMVDNYLPGFEMKNQLETAPAKKIEEQIVVLKRKTDPQTIYKLQKLDRDDIIDITDFDVVVFMKNEMRMMLNEELARAILVGDGRLPDAQDKIDEEHIRPVWTDDEMYTVHTVVDGTLTGSNKAKAFIEACIRSRKLYKGSGTPTLYVGQDLLTEMRLLRDTQGYRLYKNDQELADELRVSKIVEVELFDGLHRTVNDDDRVLGGLIVNLGDYNLGANRGGEVTLFDDFDLNYNKYEYLIETRCSGALVVPYSAMAIEFGDPTTVTTELGNGGTGSPELGETGETGTSD